MSPLVDVRHLSKVFDISPTWLERWTRRLPRRLLTAVDDFSVSLERGRTLALVGESGCGKSTVARMLVGLQAPTGGEVIFDGQSVTDALASGAARALRRRMQMIFQDPYASLNPRWRVHDIVAEPLREGERVVDPAERQARVAHVLEAVGLTVDDGQRHPHQFSGGQRQRISIARALASEPDFLVCDEPTSALDVSVQAQILNLMKDLQQARGLTYLFISHNLAVVRYMADEVAVMYLGRLVEWAPRAALFSSPQHPYTRLLLAAVPRLHSSPTRPDALMGEPPTPWQVPAGCAFHPRCPLANDRCRAERPAMVSAGPSRVACHAVQEARA